MAKEKLSEKILSCFMRFFGLSLLQLLVTTGNKTIDGNDDDGGEGGGDGWYLLN